MLWSEDVWMELNLTIRKVLAKGASVVVFPLLTEERLSPVLNVLRIHFLIVILLVDGLMQ